MANVRKTTSAPAIPVALPLYRRPGMYLVVGVALALLVRLPLVNQSLWYDEMYTLIHYVSGSWSKFFAEYSPNNHPLFSLLGRAMVAVGGFSELSLRLPSVLAGAAVGSLLAWPLARKSPAMAVALVLVAAMQPWLVVFSGEARGYALMLALCVLATGALPEEGKGIPWAYPLAMAAAVYTLPIAVLVCLGHGVAIVWLRRGAFKVWLILAALAAGLTVLLYWPLLPGMLAYFSQPQRASLEYRQFIVQVWPQLLNGWNAPAGQWLVGGLAAVVVTIAVLLGGCALAASRGMATVPMVSFAVAGVVSLAMPLAMPAACEVRFVLWLIPLYIIAVAALVAAVMDHQLPGGRLAGGAITLAGIAILAMQGWALGRIWATPPQPMSDAMAAVDQLAGADGSIVGVYMGAVEVANIYPRPANRPPMLLAYSVDQLQQAEIKAGGKLWAVVFYPTFIDRDQPGLGRYLQDNYRVYHVYPGRVSPTVVYVHK